MARVLSSNFSCIYFIEYCTEIAVFEQNIQSISSRGVGPV